MWYRGFLGNDASFMLDFVVCALVVLVPILGYSIYLVKQRQAYERHKQLQMLLGIILLVAVVVFEIDMQIHGGWRNIINKNPDLPRLNPEQMLIVSRMLGVHLIFAISTPILWVITTILALKHFPDPTQPSPHSRLHRKLGWLSTIDLTMTSVTGLMFYYLAFIHWVR